MTIESPAYNIIWWFYAAKSFVNGGIFHCHVARWYLLPVNPVTVSCYTVRVQVSKEMGELTTQLDGLKVPWYTDRAINLSFVLDGYEIPKEKPGGAKDSRKSKK
jgi:hypothetical protein